MRALLFYVAALGCQRAPLGSPQTAATTDTASLSDDFSKPETLKRWKRIHETEKSGADQVERCEISNGELLLMPYTSTWYMDYRGTLLYQDVTGDFAMTTSVRVTGRDGRSAPRSSYSLGGMMIRTPRADTYDNWSPGQENYCFFSLGSADKPGQFQYEIKTTQNSRSELEKYDSPNGQGIIQIARIGPDVILLLKYNGSWRVVKRYHRPDMPKVLQAGLTVYTDYNSASKFGVREHNTTQISQGSPDLIARYDYVKYGFPKVPPGFSAETASDAELTSVLGDAVSK